MARVQLITYPDSLGGNLRVLDDILRLELDGVFGGVHILPPYPSSGDRGFAPITHLDIDPAFGDWTDVARIGEHCEVTLDVMVNHVSRHSEMFADFVRHGRASSWADAFITLDKVWPDGVPDPGDVAEIFLRKPDHPFSDITVADTGEVERVWTSFGPRVDWSEQIDLDVNSPRTTELYETWFEHLAGHGVTTVRLDAIGYLTKRAGTACFMVEPEIWDVMGAIADLARAHGLEVLPEVHDLPPTFEKLLARGFRAYNFLLPGLVLDAVISGDAGVLVGELQRTAPTQVTLLDCHDGIPITPDLVGVLPTQRLAALADSCIERGANINRTLGAPPGDFDVHQINITYPSACGTDDAYLMARAIQLFAPGTPQVYYVGLLGARNDPDLVLETGEGRAINRRNYERSEVAAAVETDTARRQLDLIRLRNEHPAFDGSHTVIPDGESRFIIRWNAPGAWCELHVDLVTTTFSVSAQSP